MTETHSLPVDAADLRRCVGNVLRFASRDETLPVLNSVLIEGSDNSLAMTATDRYVMGRNRVRAGKGSLPPTLLRLVDAKALKRSLKGLHGIATVTVSSAGLSVTTEGYMSSFPIMDGPSFPDLSNLFDSWQDERSTEGIALSPRLLAQFTKVEADWSENPMRVWLYGPNKAAHVRIGSEFVGLIMPVRVPDHELTIQARPQAVSA